MKEITQINFVKSDFLKTVMQSIGMAIVFPDLKRSRWEQLGDGRSVYLPIEISLLRVRDDLLSNDSADRSYAQAQAISLIDSIAMGFHWVILPHYEEIMAWPDFKYINLIQRAQNCWYLEMQCEAPSEFPRCDPEKAKNLFRAARAVLASLFELTPADLTYQDLLQSN